MVRDLYEYVRVWVLSMCVCGYLPCQKKKKKSILVLFDQHDYEENLGRNKPQASEFKSSVMGPPQCRLIKGALQGL